MAAAVGSLMMLCHVKRILSDAIDCSCFEIAFHWESYLPGDHRESVLKRHVPHDVHLGDGASVLGGLTLSVVEVRRNGDHGVLDIFAEVSLSGLLHLQQHHGADLLRGERLPLALDLNLDVRLGVFVDDLEREQALVLLDGGVRVPMTNASEQRCTICRLCRGTV